MESSRGGDFPHRYGPWAVIAGASNGLGAEFAAQLAAKGLNLVLVARRADPLKTVGERLVKEYGIETRLLPLDLARADAGAVLAAETADLEIGLLVCNAAACAIAPFLETTLEAHLQELALNCQTPLALAYLFGQRMAARKRGGMIFMSSMSSSQGTSFVAHYAATKAYNRILAESLWEELRAQGVDVVVCCAGTVDTPTYAETLPAKSARLAAAAMKVGPVVSATLKALRHHRPVVIPGFGNRVINFMTQRLLPHQLVIKAVGAVMKRTYA